MNRKILNFGVIALFAIGMILTSCGKKDDGGGGSDSAFANIGVKTKGFKTVKTTHYQAYDDGKGGVAKGKEKSMDIESYDNLGRVIEDKTFGFSGGQKVFEGKRVHSYNGGVWRMISYKDENNQHKEGETIMTFDSGGRIIEMEMLDAKGKSSLKMVNHYEGDKLIETKLYEDGKDRKYVQKWRYSYNGNLREATIYVIDPDTGNEVKTGKAKILVDNKGEPIQIQVGSDIEDKDFEMSLELNDKGDIKRIMAKNTETGEEFVAIYQYEYNERGHWTKKTVIPSVLGKIFFPSIEEREIEYY